MLAEPSRRDAKLFRRHLLPGETLQWAERPRWPAGARWRWRRWLPAVNALGLAIAAVLIITFVVRTRGASYGVVIGVACVAWIVRDVVVRLRMTWNDHAYAVTDKRVLLLTPLCSTGPVAVELKDANPVIAKQDYDGSGTLVLQDQCVPFPMHPSVGGALEWAGRRLNAAEAERFREVRAGETKIPFAFPFVQNVRDVHDLILRLKREQALH